MLRHVLAACAVLTGGLLLAQAVHPAHAQSFEALEQFLRADSLEQAVAELIPGSLSHDYYACLWLQAKQRYDEVDQWLVHWRERHGESPQWRQIRHRQALLTYQRNHDATLTYLRDALGLTYDHRAISRATVEQLPSRLDPSLMSEATLAARALANRDDLAKFEDSALFRLGQTGKLSAAQRRELLARLEWPDLPNLVKLTADDLRAPAAAVLATIPSIIDSHLSNSMSYRNSFRSCCNSRPSSTNTCNDSESTMQRTAKTRGCAESIWIACGSLSIAWGLRIVRCAPCALPPLAIASSTRGVSQGPVSAIPANSQAIPMAE